jgi:hypothetical protein
VRDELPVNHQIGELAADAKLEDLSMNQDSRYTDLMQEIKERLYTIEDVLSERTALRGPLAMARPYRRRSASCVG